MTRRERSRKARRKWQKLISEQVRSGQSVAAFCRERELGRSHFWWWKKRLRTPLTKFVEVKLTPTVLEGAGAGPASRAEGLARPAADRPPAAEGRVEVVLRNGRSLWVGRGFDAGHVRALAAVLESEA
jgi:hypothetical protein